jgi:hypothetical protein
MIVVVKVAICISFCICAASTAAVEFSSCMIVLFIIPVVIVDKKNGFSGILEVLVGF